MENSCIKLAFACVSLCLTIWNCWNKICVFTSLIFYLLQTVTYSNIFCPKLGQIYWIRVDTTFRQVYCYHVPAVRAYLLCDSINSFQNEKLDTLKILLIEGAVLIFDEGKICSSSQYKRKNIRSQNSKCFHTLQPTGGNPG